MRGLLLALLLGNVVYFVWQMVSYRHQQAVVYHAEESQELLNGERLLLVDERAAAAERPIAPINPVDPKLPLENQLIKSNPIAVVEDGDETDDALQHGDAAEEKDDVQKNDAVNSAPANSQLDESAATAPESEDVAGRIAQTEQSALAAMVEQGQCLFLGAFAQQEERKTYMQRLNAVGITAQILELEVKGAVDYWVHLKPFANRQQALAQLRELQSKQIDSFIIPQGPFQNGISLGVFDRQENAEKRRQEIIAKGYNPEIGKNQKMLKELWLMLDGENSTKFSHSLFASLKKDFSAVEIQKDQCKSVAQ